MSAGHEPGTEFGPHSPPPWAPFGKQVIDADRRVIAQTFCRENSWIMSHAVRLFGACQMIEEWWLREGMHQSYGAPGAIFAVREVLADMQRGLTQETRATTVEPSPSPRRS